MAREAELELKNKLAARDKNALVKYGARMDELIAEVARVKSWKAGPPVGPLGQHVRLKPAHEHYRLAVENALGRWHTLAGMAVRRGPSHIALRTSRIGPFVHPSRRS